VKAALVKVADALRGDGVDHQHSHGLMLAHARARTVSGHTVRGRTRSGLDRSRSSSPTLSGLIGVS
jgi:hypothetical protein